MKKMDILRLLYKIYIKYTFTLGAIIGVILVKIFKNHFDLSGGFWFVLGCGIVEFISNRKR